MHGRALRAAPRADRRRAARARREAARARCDRPRSRRGRRSPPPGRRRTPTLRSAAAPRRALELRRDALVQRRAPERIPAPTAELEVGVDEPFGHRAPGERQRREARPRPSRRAAARGGGARSSRSSARPDLARDRALSEVVEIAERRCAEREARRRRSSRPAPARTRVRRRLPARGSRGSGSAWAAGASGGLGCGHEPSRIGTRRQRPRNYRGGMPRPPFVDVHSHVVPSGDDGAATVDEAVELCVEAARTGHAGPVRDAARACPVGLLSVVSGTRALGSTRPSRACRSAPSELGLELRRGAELFPSEVLVRDPAAFVLEGTRGCWSSFRARGSTFPGSSSWSSEASARIVSVGLVPVLAHPERCREVQADPAVVERLRRAGLRSCASTGRRSSAITASAALSHRLGAARGGPRASHRLGRSSRPAPADHGRGVAGGLRAARRVGRRAALRRLGAAVAELPSAR